MGYTRFPHSQLRNGWLTAHKTDRLMLLGSPPDMVHGVSLRETDPSTPLMGTAAQHMPGCRNSSPL